MTTLPPSLESHDPWPGASESAAAWRPGDAPAIADLCLVIDDHAAAVAPRPGEKSPLAALWQQDGFPGRFQALTDRCLAGEELHTETRFELSGTGTHHLELHFYPRQGGGRHQAVVVIRDITRRKAAEAATLRSEEHYRDLFHQSYQMQENLRRMSDRVLKVQEHERQRISRDLHDEVGQALTAINVNLAMLRTSLGPVTADSARRLSETQHLIEQTMANISNFSRELRPAMLDDLGLLPALRNYVKSFGERTGLAVRLDTTQSENIEQLDSERKIVVYRIVQEGLTNVAKHARARQVDIIITGSQHDVRIQLSDDGDGFTPGSTPPETVPRQLGLIGLGERVRLVGGEFAINSTPGRGTHLRATIPFKLV